MQWVDRLEFGLGMDAAILRMDAAGMETAAFGRCERIGQRAGNGAQLAPRAAGIAPGRDAIEERARLGMLGARQDFGYRALLDDLARIHHGDPIGDFADELQIMRYENHRHPPFALQAL